MNTWIQHNLVEGGIIEVIWIENGSNEGLFLYLVAKEIATRLGKVVDPLIPSNQSTFVQDRQLVDGVVAINETVYMAK